MNRERWALIDDICRAALELAPAERDAFLGDACAGHADLRREVETARLGRVRKRDWGNAT